MCGEMWSQQVSAWRLHVQHLSTVTDTPLWEHVSPLFGPCENQVLRWDGILSLLAHSYEELFSSSLGKKRRTWTVSYIPWKTSTSWRSSELGDNHSPLEKKKKKRNCAGSPADSRGSCSQNSPPSSFNNRAIFAVAFHLRPCKGILSFWGFKSYWETCCQGSKPVSTKPGRTSHVSSHVELMIPVLSSHGVSTTRGFS